MMLGMKQQSQTNNRKSLSIRQNKQRDRQRDRQRNTSPQIRIYNRNVYLRQAYKSLMYKKHQEEIERMANSEKLDIGSYRILKDKVEKYIDQTIKKVKRFTEEQYKTQMNQIQQGQAEGLSYQQMCEVIYSTNDYIRKASKTVQVERLLSQIWLYLKNYDVQSQLLPIQVLSTFLNLLMDPKGLKPAQIQQLMMTIQPFHRTSELKDQFINKYPELKDQALEEIDIFKLWFTIKQKHHIFPKHEQNNPSFRKHPSQQNLKFQPRISQNSRIIAQKSLNKYLSSQNNLHQKINISNQQDNELRQYLSARTIEQHHDSPGKLRQKQSNELNYHEILYRRKLQKELVSQKVDEAHYHSEQNIRKATPSQVKEIVQKMYFVPQKKSDIDHKALKQQQELKACTFFPTTTHYPNNKNQNVSVHGFEKQVNRLKKGREEKLKLKQTYQNLGRPKNLTARSRTPSFIQRDTPKLILEVNIGGGRIEKIKLQGNQDAKIVAKKFINKYNLESTMMSVLQELIEENLRSL